MSDHFSREQLYGYLDGELSESLHQKVTKHVAECQPCSRRLGQIERLFGTIESLPEKSLSHDLSTAIVARIEARDQLPFELPWWVALEGLAGVGALTLWWLSNPKSASAIEGALGQFDIFMLWTRYALPRAIDIQRALQSIPTFLPDLSVTAAPANLLGSALALPWVPIMLALVILWLLSNGVLLTRRDFRSYPLTGVHSRKGTKNG